MLVVNNEYIDIKIILDKPSNELIAGEEVTGIIHAEAFTDLDLNYLSYHLSYEGRGLVDTISLHQKETVLLENELLKANQVKELPFKFKLGNNTNYNGKNIDFGWRIETRLRLNENSKKEIRNRSLKKLQMLRTFNPEIGMQATRSLKVMGKGNFLYKVNESWEYMTLKKIPNYLQGFIITFLFFLGLVGRLWMFVFITAIVIFIVGYCIIGILISHLES